MKTIFFKEIFTVFVAKVKTFVLLFQLVVSGDDLTPNSRPINVKHFRIKYEFAM